MLMLLACVRIPEQTLTRPFCPNNTRSPNMLRRMIVSSAHSIWQLYSAIIQYVAGPTNLVISRVFLSTIRYVSIHGICCVSLLCQHRCGIEHGSLMRKSKSSAVYINGRSTPINTFRIRVRATVHHNQQPPTKVILCIKVFRLLSLATSTSIQS